MNLTRLAIRNAQFVLIIILIAVFIGTRSFISMPRSEDPQLSLPVYVITIAFPGTSPEDMENLIADPLEKALDELDDIQKIETKISEGILRISVEASFEIDRDDKFNEVQREVNSVRSELPDGIAFFEVAQISPEDRVSFYVFALSTDNLSYKTLHDIAENFETDLDRIDGVNLISIEAYPERQVLITLDYQRMAMHGLSLTQIIQILRANNAVIPGGDVRAGTKTFSIQSSGGYENLHELRSTTLKSYDNQIVQLSDVADVSIAHKDQLWKAEYVKKKAILMSLKLKRGFNILNVDREVKEVSRRFEESLPSDVSLDVSFEQTSGVDKRINNFFKNLLQGIVLVGVVIFLFLGWRSAVIIITLIPLSIIMALALLNGSGYALQQISIASLILALGLLVDNGIVVIENINRFIKEGYNRRDASLLGASEVGTAIISSTITTLLSFFPLTQLGEGAGEFLRSLPLTVIFTLVISLLLALTFSPIMSNWILKEKYSDEPSIADRLFAALSNRIYKPALHFAMRFSWGIIILALSITVFSFTLFPKIGVSFFPTADKPLLLIDVETPLGSSLQTTDESINYVESILDTMDFVKDYTSNVGHGNLQIFYNRFARSYRKNYGQLLVNLDEWNSRKFYGTINQLRSVFSTYPGARITVSELKNGVPVEAPIVIRVFGKDLNVLKDLSIQVEEILKRTPDVIDVENTMRRPQTQLEITLDKEKAGLLNVSELEFDYSVRASVNGMVIDNAVFEDDEDYDIMIRMPFDEAPSIEDFNKIYISTMAGGQVPLNHIATLNFVSGVSQIAHYNLDRYTPVMGSVVDLDNTVPITISLFDELEAINWPQGYYYEVGGEYEEQQNTFGNLGVILGMAALAIFAVLVLQFRSILQPFIVFSSIPLAVSGSFIALYLTGWSFSFFAFVGFISLTGIVVNNAIILVDYINQLRSKDIQIDEAIIRGCTRRFKPIILTTMTTILGLLPITVQATNQWSPLCWTIIGGMISSSVLTLLVVPILYRWFSVKKVTD